MPTRPNLLLITTDQQRFDTIAAAGNRSIFTPHLNWLCHSGTRFSRAYADCPVCAPSRATIMTGLHATTHGQISNPGASPLSRYPTLPGQLTRAGYQTRAEGKMHFAPTRAHYGFEHMEILPDYYREMARRGGPQPKDHGVGENEMTPVFATTSAANTVTHWTVERSINFLETRDEDRPFFLWTSFSKPHPPFDPPREYWDLYEGIPMPEPIRGDWSATADDVPGGFRASTWVLNNVHHFSPEQLRNVRRAYYACITHIDYSLGLLFARMRELGLMENTWIIFTSDHGEMLGDHWLGAKSHFLEGSAHVPLILRPAMGSWQYHPLASRVDDRLACLADILPTFCNLAGVEHTACDGLDLLGEARREQLVGCCETSHSLITPTHKFHFTERGGDKLLFDVSEDPYETRNLMSKDTETAAKMEGELAASLARRSNPAAVDGKLIATAPAPTETETRRNATWPGFHSRGDRDCDMLH